MPPTMVVSGLNSASTKVQASQVSLVSSVDAMYSYLKRLKRARNHQRPVVENSTRKVIGIPWIHTSMDLETRIIVGCSIAVRPESGGA
jgi:hypothetical protein